MNWATERLRQRRDEILDAWLAAVAAEPFNRAKTKQVVSDHIPRLFDAMVELLERTWSEGMAPDSPFDDPAVVAMAKAHARSRAEQGLRPADVVVEFRLLRREIRRALRVKSEDSVQPAVALAAELLVIDVLDGVISIGLEAFSTSLAEEREAFLATTLHDLGHPLTGILGRAQFLVRLVTRPSFDAARVAESARVIEQEARRMELMLSTLADASRVALGRLDLQYDHVDLRQLMDESITALPPDAAPRVQLTIPDNLDTTLHGDAPRLRRVITNVLSNAVKYAPSPTPVHVSVTGDGEKFHLDVRDEGIGIHPDDLPHLFQRYRRGHSAVTHGIVGAGLGLYLSKGIVEEHGGRIWISSPGPDQGTTLHIDLPRHRDETSA